MCEHGQAASHTEGQDDPNIRPRQLRDREISWEGSRRSKLMSRRTERSYKVDGADLRISIKDYRRNKNLKVLLYRPPFTSRGFRVTMNGRRWPKRGQDIGLARIFVALRKALARSTHA